MLFKIRSIIDSKTSEIKDIGLMSDRFNVGLEHVIEPARAKGIFPLLGLLDLEMYHYAGIWSDWAHFKAYNFSDILQLKSMDMISILKRKMLVKVTTLDH